MGFLFGPPMEFISQEAIMKIILNNMCQKQFPTKQKTVENSELEIFLFKYLHFEQKLITQEDFEKACENTLCGIKFPTEFNCKMKRAYIRCLHCFLAEKKDVRFLEQLRLDHPEYYTPTERYLKHFYYGLIGQLLKKHHTERMKLKYLHMMLSGRSLLADAGLEPHFGPQKTAKNK